MDKHKPRVSVKVTINNGTAMLSPAEIGEAIGEHVLNSLHADTPDTDTAAFEPGDIVSLASGGPGMTVVDVCVACGDVEVVWFDGDDMQFAKLPEEALI